MEEAYMGWAPISDTQDMMDLEDLRMDLEDEVYEEQVSVEQVLDTQPMVNLIDNINGTLVSDQLPEPQPQLQLQLQPPVRGRRKKSVVWKYFRVEKVGGDSERAFCNQCNKSFAFLTGTKLAGTSHLKRHIEMGICPKGSVSMEENQFASHSEKRRRNGSCSATEGPKRRGKGHTVCKLDPELCMAEMIIQHGYPLQFVEHSSSLAMALNPQYDSVNNKNKVEDLIVRIHFREKQNLMNILAGIRGRVSLSLDLWTSDQAVGYAVLTGHFVDLDWKLQRRVLSVIALPVPDSEPALNGALNACLNDWSMQRKLLAITLNQPFGIETIRHSLKGLLSAQKSDSQSSQNAAILGGQLVTGSCYARVLSSLAQDALVFGRKTVEKVRTSVKCVLVSDLYREKFRDVKQQLQVRSAKTLDYDDITNWKKTFEMLLAASELKEVFSCLDFLGANMPTVDEWIQVQTLCTYLKHLHDAASILALKVCPTSNIFFHEVCRIYKELLDASGSNEQFLSSLTKPLKEKFEKYWYDSFLILAIAAVMDPRYKLQVVKMRLLMMQVANIELCMEGVQNGVRVLYTEYCKDGVSELNTTEFYQDGTSELDTTELYQDGGPVLDTTEFCQDGVPVLEDGRKTESMPEEKNEVKLEVPAENGEYVMSDLFGGNEEFVMPPDNKNTVTDDELARYLNQEPLDFEDYEQEFDVLGWWRDNSIRYPVLSKMASDILAIPFSTASPDSVFNSAGGRMDSTLSGLRPTLVEALLCTKDWLKYGSFSLNSIVKMES